MDTRKDTLLSSLNELSNSTGNKRLVELWLRFNVTGAKGISSEDKELIEKFLDSDSKLIELSLIRIRLGFVYIKAFGSLKKQHDELLKNVINLLCENQPNAKVWTMTEVAQDAESAQVSLQERKATTNKLMLEIGQLIGKVSWLVNKAHEWRFLRIKLRLLERKRSEGTPRDPQQDKDLGWESHNLAKECLGCPTCSASMIKNLLLIAESLNPTSTFSSVEWSGFCHRILTDKRQVVGKINCLSSATEWINPSLVVNLPDKNADKWDYAVPADSMITCYAEAHALVATFLSATSITDDILLILAQFDLKKPFQSHEKKWKRQCKWHRKRFNKLMAASSTDFDLIASVCLDMLAAKNKLFEASPGNASLAQKMAYYAKTGIGATESGAAVVPSKLAAKKAAILFKRAQLYSKFFSPNVSDQMEHSRKAIESYEEVINIGENDELIRQSKDAKDLLERQLKMHQKNSQNQD